MSIIVSDLSSYGFGNVPTRKLKIFFLSKRQAHGRQEKGGKQVKESSVAEDDVDPDPLDQYYGRLGAS